MDELATTLALVVKVLIKLKFNVKSAFVTLGCRAR